MPILEYKLASREVLKYQLDVTVMEQPSEDTAEFELLLVLKVGTDGEMSSETRVENRSGPVKIPDAFLRPAKYAIPPQEGQPFLPVLPARELHKGDSWTAQEVGPDGKPVVVFYEITAIDDSQAEIVSRKVLQDAAGRRTEMENLYEFSLPKGRVLLAQTVTESQLSGGRQVRTVAEYELLD